MSKRILSITGLLVLLQLSAAFTHGEAAVFDHKVSEQKVQVSPGVIHEQAAYQTGSIHEAINLLNINLNDPYTKMEIGIPNPINSLKTTTSLAKENSYNGHRVIGATNASYFLGNGSPANLLAINNQIINYGILGDNFDSPTQKAVAFGITKSGKAIADYYQADLTFTVNGKSYNIDRINNTRLENTNVLYTSSKKTTGTNEWGTEIIVTNASKNTDVLHFGDRYTGIVAKVTQYGEPGNSAIPADGFVISIQNKELASEISQLEEGSPIEVKISIDAKWQDAQFILAAGPMLVKDGKVNISMPTSSSFVTDRNPRTAVAVDATGNRVFLVTVDGRQSGYSNGTNLQDLASYLISKGASAAINLDGGGSTTMAVRQPGSLLPVMVNRPSDGYERKVSAILQAVSTAPVGKAQTIKLNTVSGEIPLGSSFNVTVANAMDTYMNPLTIDPATMKWSVEGTIGKMEGTTFTATAGGTGKIIGEYDGIRAELSVKVVDMAAKPVLLHSFDNTNDWVAQTAKANATITTSTKYDPFRQGTSSLKLDYDFTVGESGTKAAYAVAKTPISILGRPNNIGVWVYGDNKKHWLRGVLIDGKGTKQTIDFTSKEGINWTGWKYVKAEVPANIELPLKFERIYVTQPAASLQNKGQVYFDKLQAVYSVDYEELMYTDVTKANWAYSSINNLNRAGLINGFLDGTFKPTNSITRAETAAIIARALNLKSSHDSGFTDVKKSHYAYDNIAAVAEKGIIIGREKGQFDPEGKLTRAEMAAILVRAYQLNGTKKLPFTDVDPKHWAYSDIQTLYANNLTGGFPDNTYKPAQQISRAEFVTFLDRMLQR
ncbi:S-layer homology domain-containing protein [Peribacillus loiseleuriae]|uniref:SLH domain-containing protein n=1 Tax=Peribacillus loiseleuriae TaxID=1679170 RepID=A0A0K9GZ38_9BACI|nr:S-layer homology domain-containing protein [Peribacillus loiseleuriae]KMY51865.1 hypothetical protein AC625_21970 [Peribacillus loiseleuriae]